MSPVHGLHGSSLDHALHRQPSASLLRGFPQAASPAIRGQRRGRRFQARWNSHSGTSSARLRSGRKLYVGLPSQAGAGRRDRPLLGRVLDLARAALDRQSSAQSITLPWRSLVIGGIAIIPGYLNAQPDRLAADRPTAAAALRPRLPGGHADRRLLQRGGDDRGDARLRRRAGLPGRAARPGRRRRLHRPDRRDGARDRAKTDPRDPVCELSPRRQGAAL